MVFRQRKPIATKAVTGIRRIGVITITGAGAWYPYIVGRCTSIHIAYIAGAKVDDDKRFFKSAVSRLRFQLKGE